MCVEVRLVAEALTEQEAFVIEKERIAYWRSVSDHLCNATDGGEGVTGLKHSKKSKRRMSLQKVGKKLSEETRKKMSVSQTGRKHTLESRQKLSRIKMGVLQGPHTPEHNAKISAAGRGRKDTPETRLKKSLAAKRRGPLPPDVRKAISKSVRQLWKDQAYRERLIISHTNRPPSTEAARESMRKAQRARRAAELLNQGT